MRTHDGPERDLGDEANPDLGSIPGNGADELVADEAQWAAVKRVAQDVDGDEEEEAT